MGFLFVCLKKNNHFVWHDILQNKRARKGRWEVRVFSVIVGEKHIEIQHHLESWTSKSRTKSLVSSVPFRDPTAQTSLVELARILQTTPPLPPLSKATKSRMNSPKNNNITINVFINVKYNSLYLYSTFKKIFKGSILINHLPLLTSHNFTVPSSEDVITNFELNWRQVTADWCLLLPII